MNNYCLVCTPRSGSYYVLHHLSQERNLTEGKEWYGRMKRVHYDDLKTSPITIDYTVNEDLLTNHEIEKRRMWLSGRDNFIIKCMPHQLSNTVENQDMSTEDKLKIAVDILSDYKLIWLVRKDKMSQFCFRFIAQSNSFTATKEEFDRYMKIERFTNSVRKYFPDCEEIIYEDFIKNKDIAPNPDYKKIMTNYDEIYKWFMTCST